jgi:glycosyltransferase involved in cell wall biosynthesis
LSKIKIYHFHNGSGGGVLSVIKNLLRFSINENIENHIIHAVNKKLFPEFKVEPIEGAVSQQLYFYSANNNFYFTCKKLAKLLPNDKAIIVAHDWIELGMVSNLGLQNKVLQIVHGNYEYYYQLAQKHNQIVDTYICISSKIFSKLQEKLPSRKEDIFQLNFPVPNINQKNTFEDSLQLFYAVGNLKDENKQFQTIVNIAKGLSRAKEKYFFTIAGGGFTQEEFNVIWPQSMVGRVIFLGLVSNEEIINSLPFQDIFLLPSLSEGLPVSLVEAMKAGLVPLITNWDGAVSELVIEYETGFYFEVGATDEYVKYIERFNDDRDLLKRISNNASKKAKVLFDPLINTKQFEDLYINLMTKNVKVKGALKVYGSRLDHRFIPNFITQLIRNI